MEVLVLGSDKIWKGRFSSLAEKHTLDYSVRRALGDYGFVVLFGGVEVVDQLDGLRGEGLSASAALVSSGVTPEDSTLFNRVLRLQAEVYNIRSYRPKERAAEYFFKDLSIQMRRAERNLPQSI